MALVPGNPVVGGTTLVRAAINSPNFDIANPTASPTPSWGILQSGLAYFFGLILSGGTIEGPDYIINSSGAFFYSGTPANGNLFLSIAAVAGSDAFGNAYGAGLNVGNQAANHSRLDTSGNLSIFNSSGKLVDFIFQGDGSLRIYNSSGLGTGNLIASIAPAGGTDSASNTYKEGVAAYITVPSGLGAGTYAIDLGDQASPYANVASLTFSNLTHAPNLPPALSAATDTTHGNSLTLDTGRFGSGNNDAVITLNDSKSSGTTAVEIFGDTITVEPVVNAAAALDVLGFVGLIDQNPSPGAVSGEAVLYADVNGFPRFKADSAAGDTTEYEVGHRLLFNSSNQGPINSAAQTPITGLTATLGAGTYFVKGVITGVQGATANANQGIGITATAGAAFSHMRLNVWIWDVTSQVFKNFNQISAAGQVGTGTAIAAADAFVAVLDGILVLSSGGAVNFTASTITSTADTWTVESFSYVSIWPAN